MVEPADSSVLVLAPGRDGALTCRILASAGYSCHQCRSGDELLAALDERSGAVLVAEEVLADGFLPRLASAVAAQPPWSDLPVLVVATQTAEHNHRLNGLAALGNVSVLTRPMALDALTTSVAAALRARRRQFQVRDLLHEQQEQARRKDEFLAMLAHELRNPLAPVRYAAQTLQADGLAREQLQSTATLIERQVGHMARIIEDLLDVSRVTRGMIRLSRAPLDLADLAHRSADAHAASAAARGVRISVIAPQPVWVEADASRIRQVLDNLIDNAVKFSPGESEIQVRASEREGWAELSVADHGIGIEPELIPQLFEPFIQADRSLDRTPGGLGLGLALVRGLTRLHGGEVMAESLGPGRGSTFTVRLPLGPAPTAHPERSDNRSRPEVSSPVPQVKVLIAEDNPDSAESLKMLLELCGYEVVVAHTGRDAVRRAREVRPNVVVCDVGLPELSGYEVARTLRADPTVRGTRLIAVTGYGGPEDRRAALEAGFDQHFPKPVEPGLLLAEVEKIAKQIV